MSGIATPLELIFSKRSISSKPQFWYNCPLPALQPVRLFGPLSSSGFCACFHHHGVDAHRLEGRFDHLFAQKLINSCRIDGFINLRKFGRSCSTASHIEKLLTETLIFTEFFSIKHSSHQWKVAKKSRLELVNSVN